MILIKLKCDKSINEKFRRYKVDKFKLENFLNFHTNNIIPTRKWWSYTVNVKGIQSVDSQYFWGEDEIEVALKCYNCKTLKERRQYFLGSLVHEYRHWVQSQIQRVPEKKLNYSENDVTMHNDKYINNYYELECKEWEQFIVMFDKFI